MSKTKTVDEMSVSELRDAMYKKQEQEDIDKFSTKKEAEFNIREVKSLKAKGNGSLYYVRVHDGCKGWESLVEIDQSVDDSEWCGDEEELVKNHIINFMIENNYYESGDIEGITVVEICRYNRPIFKISV